MTVKSMSKRLVAAGLLGMTAAQSVWAALPTPVAPNNSEEAALK